MSSTGSRTQKPSRRRGVALETAILSAAWEQLLAEGYGHFSIDNVAARAQTSKPVLYRRWKSSDALLLAAIRAQGQRQREHAELPDTGTLRGDMISLLVEVNARQDGLAALFSSFLGSYYDGSGTLTPAILRQEFLGDGPSRVDEVIARAVARGEVDPERLTPRVSAVPFDLFRQEIMMTLERVPKDVLEAIVDQVFLPLVLRRG